MQDKSRILPGDLVIFQTPINTQALSIDFVFLRREIFMFGRYKARARALRNNNSARLYDTGLDNDPQPRLHIDIAHVDHKLSAVNYEKA